MIDFLQIEGNKDAQLVVTHDKEEDWMVAGTHIPGVSWILNNALSG